MGSIDGSSGKTISIKCARKDYEWRLCVSNQKLNQVNRPFTFPIPRYDDAVQDIDIQAKYFIAVDMDSGYWQVVTE